MNPKMKELIIDTTINLIQEMSEKPETITNRDICKKAGIAISQINYHFQSKENLLNQCVQKMVGRMIHGLEGYCEQAKEMEPLIVLENVLNMIFTYLYENENLARISILTDHQSPTLQDNTNQTLHVWKPLIERVCAERGIDNANLLPLLLIQSLQGIFLRSDLIKQEFHIDLRDETQRNAFLHTVLESYLGAF